MSTFGVDFDMSALDDLNSMLTRAAGRVAKDRTRGLAQAARRTFDEAHANASSFTKASTGELAAALTLEGTDLTKLVGAEVRQAWFQEFGSPNTGAPNPWLTDPAERSMTELLRELSDSATVEFD